MEAVDQFAWWQFLQNPVATESVFFFVTLRGEDVQCINWSWWEQPLWMPCLNDLLFKLVTLFRLFRLVLKSFCWGASWRLKKLEYKVQDAILLRKGKMISVDCMEYIKEGNAVQDSYFAKKHEHSHVPFSCIVISNTEVSSSIVTLCLSIFLYDNYTKCHCLQKNSFHSLPSSSSLSNSPNFSRTPTSTINIVSVKSARAIWKVLMVQNCDNDILEGLAVANPLKSKIHCFLIEGTTNYSFYFLLKLQLKWNVL